MTKAELRQTDNENEQTLNFLRDELAPLKFQLKKKEDRIASLLC